MSEESQNGCEPQEATVPIILVVEDDKFTREAVSRRLNAEGYEIVSVPSAGDALIVAQRLTFHVLVLDLHLMDGDPFSGLHEGMAVLDWLKVQLGGQIPFRVVIHTSQNDPKLLAQAEAHGVFAYCIKRRDMNNLVQCVGEAVDSLRAA